MTPELEKKIQELRIKSEKLKEKSMNHIDHGNEIKIHTLKVRSALGVYKSDAEKYDAIQRETIRLLELELFKMDMTDKKSTH